MVMSRSSQSWNLVVDVIFLDDGRGQTLQVVQKTSSLVALAMHAKCTENLRQRELKLFFFEFHACMVLLTSLRPAVPK